MKPLKHPLPPGRTLEQVWRHYEVESDLARQLKTANREERKAIFEVMYDRLFSQVPDHPRLTRRDDANVTAAANREKMAWYGRFFRRDLTVAEFAPGDCEFCRISAPRVRKIYGIDISDQRKHDVEWPPNFELVVYDGYTLPQIESESLDVVFSDQFLEHLHPDDASAHLALAYSVLKKGGCYVIRTPHAQSGPWDVSQYFSDVAEGFHLKEWTFTTLSDELRRHGYSKVDAVWSKKRKNVRVPLTAYRLAERAAKHMSKGTIRPLAKYLAPMVYCVAWK
jgi:SAM-dependent methyltransferase